MEFKYHEIYKCEGWRVPGGRLYDINFIIIASVLFRKYWQVPLGTWHQLSFSTPSAGGLISDLWPLLLWIISLDCRRHLCSCSNGPAYRLDLFGNCGQPPLACPGGQYRDYWCLRRLCGQSWSLEGYLASFGGPEVWGLQGYCHHGMTSDHPLPDATHSRWTARGWTWASPPCLRRTL